MRVEIRQLEPRKAVCMTHRGPYFMIGQTFGQLGAWLKETGLDAGPGLAIYFDDPEATPAAELKSYAGVFVPDGFVSDDPRVQLVDVAGGSYAVGTRGSVRRVGKRLGRVGREVAAGERLRVR